jgi:predicted N-acetyltransferase YhbS
MDQPSVEAAGSNIVLGAASELATAGAVDAAVAGAIELNRQENGESAAAELAAAFQKGAASAEHLAVAMADGEVVSCLVLLSMQMTVGHDPAVVIPVGQPEFVATAPAFRNRGLIRALMGFVHRWSAARGDLVQLIGGIPYFYRQFGYQYGLVRPRERVVPPEVPIGAPPGWVVRRAGPADIPVMRHLEGTAQAGADVRLPWAADVWPVLIELPHTELAVAVHDDVVRGLAYLRGDPDHPVMVQGVAAECVDAARALLLRARDRKPGASLVVQDRWDSPAAPLLGGDTLPAARRKWLYLRIADPLPVLEAIRPVLSQRLARSSFSRESGSVVVSFYRSAVRFGYQCGDVVSVSAASRIQEPSTERAAGVPPDLTASLLFGEDGIAALEDHPDVELGPHRALLEVLFPRQRVDAMIW